MSSRFLKQTEIFQIPTCCWNFQRSKSEKYHIWSVQIKKEAITDIRNSVELKTTKLKMQGLAVKVISQYVDKNMTNLHKTIFTLPMNTYTFIIS